MLHIRQLEIANLATHKHTSMALPASGLVAITGCNGAGKSTILEAVATGLWGESLRGELAWRTGEAGEAKVTTDQVTVIRKRSKSGASKVEWSSSSLESAPAYETSSKAQAALEQLIGSYDVWKRTCVLSSLDSAAFSLARDSDRKRLLEEFLGLGMFDAALDACRKDRRQAMSAAQAFAQEHQNITLQLSFAQQQLVQAQKALATITASGGATDPAALKAEGQRLAGLAKAAKSDLDATQARIAAIDATVAHEHGILSADALRIAKLGTDKCGTCGQSVTELRSQLQQEAENLAAQKRKHLERLNAERVEVAADLAELQEEHQLLTSKLETLRSDFRLAESFSKQRAQTETAIADAEKAVAQWKAKQIAHASSGGAAADTAAHLEVVEQVLGLRGVRAQVLDHALTALERQANAWLSRMPTEQGILILSLSGSTTQKSGSVVDSISLKVQGRAYATCSGGERRRVDVALLLALRELAVAAHGRDGTLFCDEVFDALDSQGQADVAAALREMAQERLVVVITHSAELLAALRPDTHFHVTLKEGAASISQG